MEQILCEKETSILLIKQGKRRDIIIGAPHHTVGGVANMPCEEHTDGDENTGFIAKSVADMIDASVVIACNYQIDPNKKLTTDYASHIIKWAPKYLIEIHGHGARNIGDDVIEISSGNTERNKLSTHFAAILKSKMIKYESLKNYKVCGDFNFIRFQAKKSATITHQGWLPFHIELPPSIRKNKENLLPEFISDFNGCLAEAILEIEKS